MVAYSFKERFIKPIQVGLSSVQLSFDPPPKLQTIRARGKRRHARPGEVLQLYYGMRTKHCRSIGVAKCTEVNDITIWVGENSLGIKIADDYFCGSALVKEFANLDGFSSEQDMVEFWKKEHGLGRFEGVLIRWDPIR